MVAIVSICHKGDLEIKTAFLIYTLKKYLSGKYQIYVAIPYENSFIKSPSSLFFEYCAITNAQIFFFENEYLSTVNTLQKGDLISNKVFLWGKKFEEEFVVFMDSDISIVRPLKVEELISNTLEVKLKPANRVASIPWNEIYSLIGIPYPGEKMISSVDKRKMPPYFNSGIIVFNRSSLTIVSNYWKDFFCTLTDMSNSQKIRIPVFFRDQIALALALIKTRSQYSILNESLNFPIRSKRIHSNSLPYIIHYHQPSSVYFYRQLYNEFKEFISIHQKFLETDCGSWKNLSSGNIFYKIYVILIETRRIFRERIIDSS